MLAEGTVRLRASVTSTDARKSLARFLGVSDRSGKRHPEKLAKLLHIL